MTTVISRTPGSLVTDIDFYFDRIRINVYFDCKHLLSVPKLNELFRQGKIEVHKAYPVALKGSYKSRIEVTAPTEEILVTIKEAIITCIRSIDKFQSYKPDNKFYAISKIELVRDFLVHSEKAALSLSDCLIGATVKKHTSRFVLYDADNHPKNKSRRVKQQLLKKIFSTRTGYWGNKDRFEYVIYARYSKINGIPCAHTEFRIIGAHTIQMKTGIRSIDDLINYRIDKFFDKMDSDTLSYQEINRKAIGQWLLGLDGRRTSTRRQIMGIELTGMIFCNVARITTPCLKYYCRGDRCQSCSCEVNSAAKLKEYIRQEKENGRPIRNKGNKQLGIEKSKFFQNISRPY